MNKSRENTKPGPALLAIAALAICLFVPLSTLASSGQEGHQGGHFDPFSFVLFELAMILAVAAFGRWAAEKLNQPAVLGELLLGVALGNIGYWLERPLFILAMNLDDVRNLLEQGWGVGQSLEEAARRVFSEAQMEAGQIGHRIMQVLGADDSTQLVIMIFGLWLFSNLGVILLLFMVGLESRVDELLRVGLRSTMVATVGVAAPFLLGIAVTTLLFPQAELSVHLFLAAILCATSVGITARVFKDLDRLQTPEAHIVLGAAVMDDILGLVVLAVVSGIVVSGDVQLWDILRITLFSLVFLSGVILMGERFVRGSVPFVSRVDRRRQKLLFPITLAFGMAWLSNQIGLAAIVGAFAAGLILNEEHFDGHEHPQASETIKGLIAPLEAIFAPVFFVLMGMQVNLSTFAEPQTLYLAAAFTAVGLLGKVVSGIPAGRTADRLSVGIGMIPRGEVGLIFASVGKGLGVVTDAVFSAVVIMVVVTTVITPVLLRWSLFRTPRQPNPSP